MQLYKKTSVEDIQIKLIRAKDSTLQKTIEIKKVSQNTNISLEIYPISTISLEIFRYIWTISLGEKMTLIQKDQKLNRHSLLNPFFYRVTPSFLMLFAKKQFLTEWSAEWYEEADYF